MGKREPVIKKYPILQLQAFRIVRFCVVRLLLLPHTCIYTEIPKQEREREQPTTYVSQILATEEEK